MLHTDGKLSSLGSVLPYRSRSLLSVSILDVFVLRTNSSFGERSGSSDDIQVDNDALRAQVHSDEGHIVQNSSRSNIRETSMITCM